MNFELASPGGCVQRSRLIVCTVCSLVGVEGYFASVPKFNDHLPLFSRSIKFSVVMADSRLPGSKRVRLEEDGVDEPDFSIPSGSTAVEVPSRAEQLGHTHAKR